MERKKPVRTKTTRSVGVLKTNAFLPLLSNKMGRTFNNFKIKKTEKILLLSEINKKYKLDSRAYQQNINLKKELINDLQKECEYLKDKNKFNNEIVNEILIINNNNNYDNSNNIDKNKNIIKRKILIRAKSRSIKPSSKAKDYKNKKKSLDVIKTEYIREKQEILNLKNEIEEINEDLNENKNVIEQKKNAINGLKNKIIIAGKNYEIIKEMLEKCESEKKALNEEIIKCLGKQIKVNKEKLNEKDNIIKKNEKDINELKNKLEQLEKLIKK